MPLLCGTQQPFSSRRRGREGWLGTRSEIYSQAFEMFAAGVGIVGGDKQKTFHAMKPGSLLVEPSGGSNRFEVSFLSSWRTLVHSATDRLPDLVSDHWLCLWYHVWLSEKLSVLGVSPRRIRIKPVLKEPRRTGPGKALIVAHWAN